jgi:hypothetical protein
MGIASFTEIDIAPTCRNKLLCDRIRARTQIHTVAVRANSESRQHPPFCGGCPI